MMMTKNCWIFLLQEQLGQSFIYCLWGQKATHSSASNNSAAKDPCSQVRRGAGRTLPDRPLLSHRALSSAAPSSAHSHCTPSTSATDEHLLHFSDWLGINKAVILLLETKQPRPQAFIIHSILPRWANVCHMHPHNRLQSPPSPFGACFEFCITRDCSATHTFTPEDFAAITTDGGCSQ